MPKGGQGSTKGKKAMQTQPRDSPHRSRSQSRSPDSDYEMATITISSQKAKKKVTKKAAAAAGKKTSAAAAVQLLTPHASAESTVVVEPLKLEPAESPVFSEVTKGKRLVLTPAQEEMLLYVLHSNPCIYDKTLREYQLTDMKGRLWQEQADLMSHACWQHPSMPQELAHSCRPLGLGQHSEHESTSFSFGEQGAWCSSIFSTHINMMLSNTE